VGRVRDQFEPGAEEILYVKTQPVGSLVRIDSNQPLLTAGGGACKALCHTFKVDGASPEKAAGSVQIGSVIGIDTEH
jgi:hypothetical protein